MKSISFKDAIDQTFQQQNWNYYKGKEEFTENPMLSIEKSKEFIRNFIKLSRKAENELNKQIDKVGMRATHIVSTFFIGHYIYQNNEKIRTLIEEQLENLKQKWKVKSNVNFSFIWFLTCLFHDLGYAIEKYEGIKYDSLEALSRRTAELMEVEGIPTFYKDIHSHYYDYRIKHQQKNDHGITAAYLLFDSLCKIRTFEEDSGQSSLCWEKGLENVYNFCAWNILAHNIWFCNESDKEKVEIYKYFHLDKLILDDSSENKYKITLVEYPFFFFLCLVDTIEPYKRIYDKIDNYEMLSQITLKYSDTKIEIISELDGEIHEKILRQAETLNDWLTPVKRKEKVVINLSVKQNKRQSKK